MKPLAPQYPSDRFEVYRFFNGLSAEGKAGLDRAHTRAPLVKTFLLEHVARRGDGRPKPPADIFEGLGVDVQMLDDHFMALTDDVLDPETKQQHRLTTGFVEQYDERFFAYYTCEGSAEAKKRLARWIQAPDLDAAWFSSPLLQVLWNRDVKDRGDGRFAKLVFSHESIFDMPDDSAEADAVSEEEDEYETETSAGADPDKPDIERRKARFEMGDRIGRIKESLTKLQEDYAPLHALYALRLPSRLGRGGHDLYQTGQITNRADNFEDHRNTVRYLYRTYKAILAFTEECAWSHVEEPAQGGRASIGMKGVPLVVQFGEPLSEATFNRWVQMAFQKRNRFRLWGNPIRLGPTKVHVYGADRHLWQPINLELTAKGVVAILPKGTCGNTFHRLVTNIQHYVCPKIQAWIGSESFESVVSKQPANPWRSDEA